MIFFWHAEEPLDHVQVMRDLINQQATAFSFQGGTMVGLRTVPVSFDPRYSQSTIHYHLQHPAVIGICTDTEHGREDFTAGDRRLIHPVYTFSIHTDRLFGNYVQSVFKGVDRNFRMEIVRGSNNDSIHVTGGDKCLINGITQKLKMSG